MNEGSLFGIFMHLLYSWDLAPLLPPVPVYGEVFLSNKTLQISPKPASINYSKS